MAALIENLMIKAIIWSPILQMVVMTGGVFISFLISYLQGDVSIYLPYISETGASIPEMGIFSITLVLGSFTGAVMVLYRYAIIDDMVTNDNPKVFLANKLALLSGLVSMAGLIGVAAFPMSASVVVHVVIAGFHFGPILGYFYLHSYISLYMIHPYYNKLIIVLRILLSILLSLFLLLLCIFLGVGHFTWLEYYPNRLHATKTPNDEVFWVLFSGALFEWIFYGAFMAFTLTFFMDFRKFVPVLSVKPVSHKSISDHPHQGLEAGHI